MKSKLVILGTIVLLSVVTIALTRGVAYAETDETLKANVPFAFYAGNQVMPAGNYSIGIDVENSLVTITDHDGRNRGILLATTTGDGSDGYALVFDHNGGQYFLRGLKSDMIDLSVPVTREQTSVASATGPEQVQVAMAQ
jgi:hypothetical protein